MYFSERTCKAAKQSEREKLRVWTTWTCKAAKQSPLRVLFPDGRNRVQTRMSLFLSVMSGEYAVCRLAPHTAPPAWAFAGELWSVTRTPDELSVVCAARQVPEEVQAAKGWAALKLRGPFDFGLTGILASVLNPLRDAGIGIFALSTFDTDYVLVAQEQVEEAVSALQDAGHSVI